MKLLLLILILVPLLSLGQQLGLGLSVSKKNTQTESATIVVDYCAEADSLFVRMDVQPSPAIKGYYNTFIKGLVDSLLFDKFLVFVLCNGETVQQSMLNIISRNFNTDSTGTIHHTIKKGFYIDWDDNNLIRSGYMGTNFIPGTHGSTIYTQNNASIGMYLYYDWTSNVEHFTIGNNVGANRTLCDVNGLNNFMGYINGGTGGFNFTSDDQNVGFYVLQRRTVDLNQTKYHEHGNTPVTYNRASQGLSDQEMYIFNDGGDERGGDGILGAYFIGGGFTDSQVSHINTLLEAFMVAMGYGGQ